jgi:ABC-2 type transport system ATP-binding protein
VAVLREGRIVALGKPSELAGARVATEIRYRRNGQELVVETHEPTRVLHQLTGEALAAGLELEALQVRRPTLEETYLELTEGGEE